MRRYICGQLALLLRLRAPPPPFPQNQAQYGDDNSRWPDTAANPQMDEDRQSDDVHACHRKQNCHTRHLLQMESVNVGAVECADPKDETRLRSTSDVLCNIRDLLETRHLTSSPPPASSSSPLASAAGAQGLGLVERLLASIIEMLETRLRSDAQLRQEADKNQEMMNEWMIAAAVIDRVCFIAFSLCFLIGTVVLFILATAVQH